RAEPQCSVHPLGHHRPIQPTPAMRTPGTAAIEAAKAAPRVHIQAPHARAHARIEAEVPEQLLAALRERCLELLQDGSMTASKHLLGHELELPQLFASRHRLDALPGPLLQP